MMKRLFVFLFICFGIFFLLFNLIYNKLDKLFFPVLCYFFIAILAAQFAFIRKVDVDNRSYILVLTGIMLAILADGITALALFYQPGFAYEKFSVMFFYGISQYLVVVGIVQEKQVKVEDSFTEGWLFEPVEDPAG